VNLNQFWHLYKKYIPVADRLYDEHLAGLEAERKKLN